MNTLGTEGKISVTKIVTYLQFVHIFALQFRILVNAEKENIVSLVIVDQEKERVVGNEVRVEKGSGRPEPEESRGGGCLAAFFVNVDKGLVDRAGK